MTEKSFPKEASDLPMRRNFYAESLRNDTKNETDEFLPDPAEETGRSGDLGGGYNDLNAGRLKPTKPQNPYWPNEEERAAGREGIQRARGALERAQNPQTEEEDPS